MRAMLKYNKFKKSAVMKLIKRFAFTIYSVTTSAKPIKTTKYYVCLFEIC